MSRSKERSMPTSNVSFGGYIHRDIDVQRLTQTIVDLAGNGEKGLQLCKESLFLLLPDGDRV